MVLAGWASKWILEHEEEGQAVDAANAVLKGVMPEHFSALRLMAVWEFYHGDSDQFRAEIDERLGISNWSSFKNIENRRIGSPPVACEVDDNWVERGLHALLLGSGGSIGESLKDVFGDNEARRWMWKSATSRKWLDDLASIEAMGIDESDREKRISTILELIREREIGSEMVWVRKVVGEPISAELWGRFRKELRDTYAKHRWRIDLLVELGVKENNSESTEAGDVIRRGLWAPRDSFIAGNNWVSGLGDFLGQPLGEGETIDLFYRAEQRCCAGIEKVKQLSSLPNRVSEAIRNLKDNGVEPDLIVLPQGHRFACALHQVGDYWRIEGINDGKDGTRGKWHGIRVITWPYVDARSVLVAQAGRLFGKQKLEGDTLKVTYEDVSDKEKAKWLQEVEKKMKVYISADRNLPKVLVSAELVPSFGILDLEAGITLHVADSDGAYAMIEGDDVYHRIDCEKIREASDQDKVVKRRLVEYLEGEERRRKPCRECQPERMDYEKGKWIDGAE